MAIRGRGSARRPQEGPGLAGAMRLRNGAGSNILGTTSSSAFGSVPPAVLRDMYGGIDVAIPSTFGAWMQLYRFSSSQLFDEGHYVSP